MGGFWNENKNTILLICIVAIGVWYVFGSGSGNNNNVDARLQGIETKLSDIAEQQRATTKYIESAQGTASSIADTAKSIDSGLADAQTTVDRGTAESEAAGNAMRDAASTIESCQKLIDGNREIYSRSAAIFDRIEQSNQSGKK